MSTVGMLRSTLREKSGPQWELSVCCGHLNMLMWAGTANSCKAAGNDSFTQGEIKEAKHHYTKAIDALHAVAKYSVLNADANFTHIRKEWTELTHMEPT